MGNLHCIQLTSVKQLRAAATAWDDLWWRSDAALPTARAELLAQWIEQFKPGAGFRALIIADQQQWVAALPLVSCRVGGVMTAGGLPSNSWTPCGELLLSPAADADAVLDCLLEAVAELPWQLLWLNDAQPESPRWQAFLRACDRAGVASNCHERFRVGRVEIDHNWELYQKRLPKNHRQTVHRALRRLNDEGTVQFEMQSRLDVQEVEPWLQAAFELEDRGWKSEAQSSVLHTPNMFRFLVGHAQQLARWGQLATAALRLNGQMLAYIYGFRAKGVYFAHKISYDPAFAAYSPGQVLFNHVLEQLHADSEAQALDFVGPLNQSLSRWRPATYAVGRVVLAPRKLSGRVAMYAYTHWWRPYRQWKTAAATAQKEVTAT